MEDLKNLVAHNLPLDLDQFKVFAFVRRLFSDYQLARYAILRDDGRTRYEAFNEVFGYRWDGASFAGVSGEVASIEAAAESIESNPSFKSRYAARTKLPISEINQKLMLDGLDLVEARVWTICGALLVEDHPNHQTLKNNADMSITISGAKDPEVVVAQIQKELSEINRLQKDASAD